MPSPTVMVVEDDPAIIYLIERYARKSRCEVISTTYSPKALAMAKEERPAMIMLDILMPEMDGWQVLQALKNDPVTRDIPVVICSALDDKGRGQAEGAVFYLRKPILYSDFVAALINAGISGATP